MIIIKQTNQGKAHFFAFDDCDVDGVNKFLAENPNDSVEIFADYANMRKNIESHLMEKFNEKAFKWFLEHTSITEPHIEYNKDGEPLAESWIAHEKAREKAAHEMFDNFKNFLEK